MTLTEAVKATYAVIGQETTDIQLAMAVEELALYARPDVFAALSRCRKELRKLTLADILDRLPGGHPGPEEAWALVSKCMNNEQISITWTNEMRVAYGSAAALSVDAIAARMAFKEVYAKLVNEARTAGSKPTWSVSLGYNPALRTEAIEEAVRLNRISQAHANVLLPEPTRQLADMSVMPEEIRVKLLEGGILKAVPDGSLTRENNGSASGLIAATP